jgi:tol-pal system protein YbgF
MMTLRLWVGGLLCVCMAHASAGLFEDDEARRAILELRQSIADMRQKNDTVEQRASDENAQLKRSLLDLQNQLEALRADLAKLRGQDEQIAREVAEAQRRQKDFAQALDERLRKLEPVKVQVDGREIIADPSEKRDFEAALAVFRKGEFVNAQVVLVDFLNRYGQSGYRPSALFWLGNAQYATKDYKEAIANFRALVAASPDHIRAPEALLAIGNCQIEMKDAKAARKTLDELVATYPNSEAAAAAKERIARMK